LVLGRVGLCLHPTANRVFDAALALCKARAVARKHQQLGQPAGDSCSLRNLRNSPADQSSTQCPKLLPLARRRVSPHHHA
jgi:hypothetical protein